MARGIKLTMNRIFVILSSINNDSTLTPAGEAERFGLDPATIYHLLKNYIQIGDTLWKKMKIQ